MKKTPLPSSKSQYWANRKRRCYSVLLSVEEEKKVETIAAKLTIERGTWVAKSALMREAILRYVELFESPNGKGNERCQPPRRKSKPSPARV